MENQRLFLFIALSLVVLLLWNGWVEFTNPQVASTPTEQTRNKAVPAAEMAPAEGDSVAVAPTQSDNSKSDLPNAPATDAEPQTIKESTASAKKAQTVRVVTDVLDLDISTLGGDIRRAYLLKYPITSERADEPYPLMGDNLPQFYVAQSGLLANTAAPDHHATYTTQQSEYLLGDANELRVPLVWEKDGVRVTKTFVFKRDEYLINVEHKIENMTAQNWKGRQYRQFQRAEYDEEGKSRMIYTFTGGIVSTKEEPYQKIDLDEMAEWKANQSYEKDGWAAMIQHYFVTAWLPPVDEANHFFSRALNDARYVLGLTSSEVEVAPQSSYIYKSDLYIGPKEQKRLEAIHERLNLTVDYGFLTIISDPLFWLLRKIHEYVGNWGWSIILLTILIKLAFYKLSEASYRSMANMRKVAPKFQAIRDRYGDDRQRMSAAMMELYKKEKVNPMSGCWPMLVQIPVFIALYWVLLESVEIRQAPFILWIQDLSAKDPYYILPLLMGASMWIQHKLSANPSLDPMQQKIMQFLPIIFTLFFMLFPAGLVLYWVVNNLLSITQQWYILRKFEKASK